MKPMTTGRDNGSFNRTVFALMAALAILSFGASSNLAFGVSSNFAFGVSSNFASELIGQDGQVPAAGADAAFEQLDIPYARTRVRLLIDNVESWYARWHILSNARVSIDTTYFIVENDVFGYAFLGLLLEKARAGVRVRLMVDARGSGFLANKFTGGQYSLQELVESGAEVHTYNPTIPGLPQLPGKLKYFISSNHDKIIVVDGEWVIMGGRNLSHHYLADPVDNPHVFRDTDILVQDRTVADSLTLAFEEEFDQTRNFTITRGIVGNILDHSWRLLSAKKAMDRWLNDSGLYLFDGNYRDNPSQYNEELLRYPAMTRYADFELFRDSPTCLVKVLDKHSIAGSRDDISDALIALIDSSREEIIIQNPYIVLTDKARAAFQRASDRGVKIIIHTNSPVSHTWANSLLTQAFFMDEWQNLQLAMPAMEVWAYGGHRLLHSKVFVFDRQVTVVGSYNMDSLSEQINSEVISCIMSESFAEQMTEKIMIDLENSMRYRLSLAQNGERPVELFGPSKVAKGRLKMILDLLKRLKFLRPLV